VAAIPASAPPRNVNSSVTALITTLSVVATASAVVALPHLGSVLNHRPLVALQFLALTLVLQMFSVRVNGGGRIGVSAVGMLATGIVLGPATAMAVALVAALVQWIRSRGLLYRAVFDAAMFSLDVAAATLVYKELVALNGAVWMQVAAAFAAGVVLSTISNGLLCIAIGLDEGVHPLVVWRDRFRWARFHYLAFGPLALAAARGFDAIGFIGLVAFTLPPGLLLLSVHQYVERTREALDQERAAKESYRAQSEDMQALFELTGGLAVRSHDRGAVVTFAEQELASLIGADAVVIDSPQGQGIALETGGKVVGMLQVVDGESFDAERWERLRPAIVPQLATAIESAELVERVWRTHLETIAALSRSMEAKDYYTGSHTERVASIAVALARRLGFTGAELDAVEIGALLHDVGKIGIPERILNKPDALDAEEWKVMKKHPVISDHILSEVDLHPIVRQIARHSHERYDGIGYPDGVAGEEIPLAARIVLVADALDALTTDRPYRPARHLLAALQEIREHTGSQFCPTVVAALEEVFRREPHVLGVGSLRAVG
jgi:ribonuclease P protein subunit RPR2